MQSRRTFLKTGIVGSAFLPTFVNLAAKAEGKIPVGQDSGRKVNLGIVGFGSMGKLLAHNLMKCKGVCVKCVCDIWKFQVQQAKSFFKYYKQAVNTYMDFHESTATSPRRTISSCWTSTRKPLRRWPPNSRACRTSRCKRQKPVCADRSAQTGFFYDTISFRRRFRAPFSRRETWAWEMPMVRATSVWVLPS